MATANRHVDLECPVCHEDFTEAKFLPCVHVVCRKCVISWLSTKGQGGCLLCRAPILPSTQAGQGDVISLVDKLPTDLATMALVESKRALADSHVCSVCENDIAATSICPDCNMKLCAPCAKGHTKIPTCRDHVLEDLKTLTAERLAARRRSPCSSHPDRPADLYCPQHLSLFCLQCFSSSHEECTGVKPIASIAKQKRETLTEQARRLRDRESEMTAHISKLDRELADAHTHFNSMRSKVKATFDDLQQMVEKRRQEINTKLQEEENSVVTPKRARKASLEEQRASVAAHAGSVERLVVPSPDSVLLGMLEKLRTRLDDLEKQTQLSPDSQDVRLASFTFNSDMVKRFEEAYAAFGVVTSKGEPNTRRGDLLGKQPDELKKACVKLCSDHFEESQFTVPTERRRLNWNAVPTLFAVPNPPPAVTSHRKPPKERTSYEPSQKMSKLPGLEDKTDAETAEGADHAGTSVEPTVSSNSPQKRTLRRKVKQLSNRLYRLRKKSKQEKAKTATNQPKKDAPADEKKPFLACGGLLTPKQQVKPTGAELAEVLKAGDRVKRGKDWGYGNQDGTPPGPGTVVHVNSDSTVRVQWDCGNSYCYRMGREGSYELELA